MQPRTPESQGKLTAKLGGPLVDDYKRDAYRHLIRQEEMHQKFRARLIQKDLMTRSAFRELLEEIYETGAQPDFVYTTLEIAYERRIIGRWQYLWLRLLRFLGRWKQNVSFGVLSARQTRGTPKTER